MRNKGMMIVLLLCLLTLGYGVLATTARQNAAATNRIVALPLEQARRIYNSPHEKYLQPRPLLTRHYTEGAPATIHPVLRWSRVAGAVMYDVQVLRRHEADNGPAYYEPIMDSQRAYTNGIEVALPDDFVEDSVYIRICGLNLDGRRISEYSNIEEVPIDRLQPFVEKPELLNTYNQGNGEVLLYPVYDWLPVPGAASYEVEVLDAAPENPNGLEPSAHRIDVYHTEYGQKYDEQPRYGSEPFYWRVRAFDEKGGPIGVWSDAQSFTTDPAAHYDVATFGDSISHGGGSISYSPTDWDFSYQHYLAFPSVNLARSADTSTTSRERFEDDVLPFQPQYLIILMGSNSLRNGEGADIVISDMKAVKEKCLAHGIRPVFLTVPPVNPGNIRKAFDDATIDDWEYQTARVNSYVRSQVHIDITPGMYDEEGKLKTELALDGLHLDPPGKKLMAQAINAAWDDIVSLPDSAWDD